MLQLSATPPTAPYTSEIQEEWSTKFREPIRKTTGITESGLAEIKPHKDAAIRTGLYQLRKYLRESESLRTGPRRIAGAREIKKGSVWMITYLPLPENTLKPTHVRVFAHKLNVERLIGNEQGATRPGGDKKARIPPFDSLVLSRRILDPPIKLPRSIYFPTLDKPDMFGLAIEDYVRDRFERAYGRPRTHRLTPGRKGADVLWNELAGLFRELAAETGDAYWSELSDELLSEL